MTLSGLLGKLKLVLVSFDQGKSFSTGVVYDHSHGNQTEKQTASADKSKYETNVFNADPELQEALSHFPSRIINDPERAFLVMGLEGIVDRLRETIPKEAHSEISLKSHLSLPILGSAAEGVTVFHDLLYIQRRNAEIGVIPTISDFENFNNYLFNGKELLKGRKLALDPYDGKTRGPFLHSLITKVISGLYHTTTSSLTEDEMKQMCILEAPGFQGSAETRKKITDHLKDIFDQIPAELYSYDGFQKMRKNFEETRLDVIVAGALMAHGTYFDFMNLVADDFTSKDIRQAVNSVAGKDILDSVNLSNGYGMNALLSDISIYRIISEEKRKYLESVKQDIISRAYYPLAVRHYLISLARINASGNPDSGLLNWIAQKEFLFTLEKRDYNEYCKRIADQKDLSSIVGARSLFLDKKDARTGYITAYGKATPEKREIFLCDDMIGLFRSSYRSGWGELLISEERIDLVCKNPGLVSELAQQETGALIQLLANPDYLSFYLTGEKGEPEILFGLMAKSRKLFSKTLHARQISNSLFIQNLTQIISSENGLEKLTLDSTKIKIIESIDPFQVGHSAIVRFLDEYELVQRACLLGIAPFKSAIDPENQNEVILWYSDNSRSMHDEIRLAEQAIRFTAGFQSDGLRRKVIEAIKTLGIEFCEKHLLQFSDAGPIGYERVIGLFVDVPRMPRLTRKTEFKNSFKYLAANTKEENYERFKKELATSKNPEADLERLFKLYYSWAPDTTNHSGTESSSVARAYKLVAGTQYVDLITTLGDLRNAKQLSLETYEAIGELIAGRNFHLSEKILEIIKAKSLTAKVAKEIVETYTSEEVLEIETLEDFVADKVPTKPQDSETKATKILPPYDFSGFDAYVKEQNEKLDPALLRSILYHGFKFETGKPFIAGNILPARHVRVNTNSKTGSDISDVFSDYIKFLVHQGAVLFHEGKGGAVDDQGCVSVNNSVESETNPLHRYVAYICYAALKRRCGKTDSD